jgi:hypothetical protein
MSYPLKTYLHDHLAGASLAIELLETMLTKQLDAPLKTFLTELLAEVIEDRDQLKLLAEYLNLDTSKTKETAAWFSEKLSRLKFGAADTDAFELFEVLELIELGIRGKLQLWRALEAASIGDESPDAVDLQRLITRAETQYAGVEKRRLSMAKIALTDY